MSKPATDGKEGEKPKPKGGANELELEELGPRFEMRLYEIKLGTLDMADTADSEWKLRPFMNTAKKRQHLSDNKP